MKIVRIPSRGFGSNIYVVQDEKMAVIDTGFPDDFEYVVEIMKKNDLDPKKVDFILNTHCHYDHVGGNHFFMKISNCQVFVHEMDSTVIEKGDNKISCAEMFGGRLMPIKVSRKLLDGDEISLGDCALKILHTPGHTIGSMCILLKEEKALFSGDTVFAEGFGRTDLPTGNLTNLIKSLQRLLSESFEILYPGHGEVSDNGKSSVRLALELAREYAETKGYFE